MPKSFDNFISSYTKLSNDNIDFVVATIVDVKGSTPQDVGARCIFTKNEIVYGTVGGGKIEFAAWQLSLELLKTNSSKILKTWNLQRDIGMTCGGEVTLFFETFKKEDIWTINIFGAGHVSQELVRLLLRLDCKVNCIDPRSEWLEKLPEDKKLNTFKMESPNSILKSLPAERGFYVLITKGHAFDFPILKEILETKKPKYLGVIGSIAKRNVLEKELRSSGLSEALSSSFICPMGEKIGSNHPAEIALSIASELLKLRDM